MGLGFRVAGLFLVVLAALPGCDSSDPSCRRACNAVYEYAQNGNFNEAPRLTPCDELCAHRVAGSFERCCAERDSVWEWLGCEEHATNSVRLADDQSLIWEWVLTGITFDAADELVRIEGVMAVSARAAAGCTDVPAAELTYEFTLATGEATDHEPVAVTPISLDEYEAAKWDVVVGGPWYPWYPEVPDLGVLSGRWSYFREWSTLVDEWASLYVSMQLPEGMQVRWRLMIPSCQEL